MAQQGGPSGPAIAAAFAAAPAANNPAGGTLDTVDTVTTVATVTQVSASRTVDASGVAFSATNPLPVIASPYLPGHGIDAQTRTVWRVLAVCGVVAVLVIAGRAMAQDPSAIVEAITDAGAAGAAMNGIAGGGTVVGGLVLLALFIAILSKLGVPMPPITIGGSSKPASSPAPAHLGVDPGTLQQVVAAVMPVRGDALDDRVAELEAKCAAQDATLRDNIAEQKRLRGEVRRLMDEAGRLLAVSAQGRPQ